MTQYLQIHPANPQQRLIDQVVAVIQQGGIIVYPTDSTYALGCQVGNKSALARIQLIRKLDKNHNFTLVCRDLSELATYAHIDNPTFRLLKANTPGPYTFILPATHEVPKRLQHPKRKTIGLRIPDNRITLSILATLNEPLMSVTLMLPEHEYPLTDPEEIYQLLNNRVDLVIDGGTGGIKPTSIIDLVDGTATIIREGKGDISPFIR